MSMSLVIWFIVFSANCNMSLDSSSDDDSFESHVGGICLLESTVKSSIVSGVDVVIALIKCMI